MHNSLKQALDAYDFRALSHKKVVLAVPDATRAIDYQKTLGPLLKRLIKAQAQVKILIALGLHRPMTPAELTPIRQAIGALPVSLTQHDATSSDLITIHEDVGLTSDAQWPLPAQFHRSVVEADHLICVGLVEPHQYAGFSGGVKTIGIGCAGAQTISAMHGLTYLRDPKTRLGQYPDNPFQQALWRTTGCLDAPIDILQFVPQPGSNQMLTYGFGPAKATFDALTASAAGAHFSVVDEALGWVHLPVPAAKATNFYQASRAATYVSLSQPTVVKPNGWILLEAPCHEGIGDGRGEEACAALFKRGHAWLIDALHHRQDPTLNGGEQRAFVIAQACQHHNIALIGAPQIDELQPMGILQFKSLAEACAKLHLAPDEGCTMEDVIHKVPRLKIR